MKKRLLKISTVLLVMLAGLNVDTYAYLKNQSSLQSPGFPIIINSISAIRNRDRTVSVNWVVFKEVGTRQYELERSIDGVTFSPLDMITTTSNNGERAVYDMIDWNALNKETYYRIKAVGLTGRQYYSAIVKVDLVKVTLPISVYPNPVANKVIHVHFTNQPAGDYSMVLFNKLGQAIWKVQVAVDNSNDVRSFQLGHNIGSGSYQLSVITPANEKIVQQLIIN